MGPARTPSVSSYRYHIVFINDFSRVSWDYLLKDRVSVHDTIKKKFMEIINQYFVCPKVLRTDNALEFIQMNLQSYCESLGVIHQISCSHTSQQNDVAKRKHRHILDVARSIMLEMHVPKYLWSDAVLTASYLINRMPSTPLGEEIPLRRLRPDVDIFTLTLRVFGYVAFVQYLTSNLDKLAPRSIRCVFLGYSRTQRGYRCYIPATRKYIISADVTFFENHRFFDSVVSSSESIPLPSIVESGDTNANDTITTEKEVSGPLQVYRRRPRPLQPFLLHLLQICHPQTYICQLPLGKVHVLPLHIPFLILLAMIDFTLLTVLLHRPLLLSHFLGTTKRLSYYHSGRQPWMKRCRL